MSGRKLPAKLCSLYLDEDLLAKVRQEQVEEERGLNAVVRKALREYFARKLEREKVTNRLAK